MASLAAASSVAVVAVRGATPSSSSSSSSSSERRAVVLLGRRRRLAVARGAADPAHSGIVDESFVHGSSLVSTGLAPSSPSSPSAPLSERIGIMGVHHVAVIVENLERSMAFYEKMLGLAVNPDRPHDKLPYDGAWLMIGPEMVHLMELPNPDPTDAEFRPVHGGKDRHFCIGVRCVLYTGPHTTPLAW